jgi:hypothetical protein
MIRNADFGIFHCKDDPIAGSNERFSHILSFSNNKFSAFSFRSYDNRPLRTCAGLVHRLGWRLLDIGHKGVAYSPGSTRGYPYFACRIPS